MSNNFTIKQVIDIVDKNIEMENKFDCSKVDLMHTIIVQNEKIDKAIDYLKKLYDNLDYYYQIEDGLVEEEIEELLEILGDKE